MCSAVRIGLNGVEVNSKLEASCSQARLTGEVVDRSTAVGTTAAQACAAHQTREMGVRVATQESNVLDRLTRSLRPQQSVVESTGPLRGPGAET